MGEPPKPLVCADLLGPIGYKDASIAHVEIASQSGLSCALVCVCVCVYGASK